jgi:hypothetical protein
LSAFSPPPAQIPDKKVLLQLNRNFHVINQSLSLIFFVPFPYFSSIVYLHSDQEKHTSFEQHEEP